MERNERTEERGERREERGELREERGGPYHPGLAPVLRHELRVVLIRQLHHHAVLGVQGLPDYGRGGGGEEEGQPERHRRRASPHRYRCLLPCRVRSRAARE